MESKEYKMEPEEYLLKPNGCMLLIYRKKTVATCLSGTVVRVPAMKATGEVEVPLHLFFTSAPAEDKCLSVWGQ